MKCSDNFLWLCSVMSPRLASGQRLGDALASILVEEDDLPFERSVLEDVAFRVVTGVRPSKALRAHPDVFIHQEVDVLAAAEEVALHTEVIEGLGRSERLRIS